MGTWGYGMLDSDRAADLIDDMNDHKVLDGMTADNAARYMSLINDDRDRLATAAHFVENNIPVNKQFKDLVRESINSQFEEVDEYDNPDARTKALLEFNTKVCSLQIE